MWRRVIRGSLIAIPLLVGILVPASSAIAAAPARAHSGGIGVRLIAGPVAPNQTALGRSYIVERLSPGASIRRRIQITNTTRSTANVSVYTAGARLDRGTFAFAPDHDRNELSRWTSVSRSVLRLPPGGVAVETVMINVPRRASAGERYAVVWAQVSAPAPADGGITLVNRVGVRMYVSIGAGGALPGSFTIGPLTPQRLATGYPRVVATVRNSGRRTLDISGTLTLSEGPGGLRAGPFPVKLGAPLAPNDSEPAVVQLDKRLPRGPWRVAIHLTSGALARTSAATLTFPAATAAGAAADSSFPIWAIAIVLALLVAVAVGVLLFGPVRRGRRPPLRRGPRPEPGAHPR